MLQLFGKLIDPESLYVIVLESLGPEITMLVRDGIGPVMMWNPRNPTSVYDFLLSQVGLDCV